MAKRRQKNFFITLILIIFFWSTLILMLIFVEPESVKDILIPNFYLPFFINLFLSLFLTLAVIFLNSRRSFIITFGIIIFLILRLYNLGNILNAILISAAVFSLEYYFTREK
jgi:hypothetical protein